jgi:hypothetical protein
MAHLVAAVAVGLLERGALRSRRRSRIRLRPESKRADAQIRTGDPFITSEVLYQLSYVGDGP